ncbi:hypothetical protein [Marinicrinis lubricantis]|uniref:Uncharacterized protein n=1 Tax=Marinicrinis lubricantis TaxID=2086470 RepID=A0ABW1IM58_9BACL
MAESLMIRIMYIGFAGFSGWLFFLLWLRQVTIRPFYSVLVSLWLGMASFCLLELGKYVIDVIWGQEAELKLSILELDQSVSLSDVLMALLIAMLLGLICAGILRMKRWKPLMSGLHVSDGKDSRVKCFVLDRVGYEIILRGTEKDEAIKGRLEDAEFYSEYVDLLLSSVSVSKRGQAYEVDRLYVTKSVRDVMIEFHDWELQTVSRKHRSKA